MNSVRPRSRWAVPSVVKQLGAVSFLNDLASEMVYPLLPALVTLRLGGGAVSLGALDGAAEAASSLAKLGSGWLADRTRRRTALVVGGYAVAAVSRPLMALAGAAWHVVALRGTDRLGKGARTPARDAVIADATEPALRGRAFGLQRAMDHAGAVAGPLVAWALLAGVGLAETEVLLWSAVPGFAAVALVAWAMARVGVPADGGSSGAGGQGRAVGGTDGAVALVGLIVAFAFVRFPEALFLLRLQDLGLPLTLVPIAWAGLHVVRAAASYPGGWLSDRIGARRTMLVGWAVYAVVCLGLGLAGSAALAAAWFLAFGLVAATTESPERALIASAAPAARRGRSYGIYHAAVGVAALPGGFLFGLLYRELGAPPALWISAGLAAALCAGGTALLRRPL